MDKISPCLWFDGAAEEAARLYTSLIPNSRIVSVDKSPADTPSGPKDSVITVEFTLAGRSYIGLNGGPDFKFTEAISLSIDCDDQAEVDRYWSALIADGGEESVCGWLKDKFGLSWQVVPRRMTEMLASSDRDAAERAMKAMLGMRKLDIAELERAFAGESVGAAR
jgi:predicted 3-demethylubiquinone-9 3-methyltransferase (glyoxalase superfamily)